MKHQKRGMCGGSDGEPCEPRRCEQRAARKEGAWRRAIVASPPLAPRGQVAEDERAYVYATGAGDEVSGESALVRANLANVVLGFPGHRERRRGHDREQADETAASSPGRPPSRAATAAPAASPGSSRTARTPGREVTASHSGVTRRRAPRCPGTRRATRNGSRFQWRWAGQHAAYRHSDEQQRPFRAPVPFGQAALHRLHACRASGPTSAARPEGLGAPADVRAWPRALRPSRRRPGRRADGAARPARRGSGARNVAAVRRNGGRRHAWLRPSPLESRSRFGGARVPGTAALAAAWTPLWLASPRARVRRGPRRPGEAAARPSLLEAVDRRMTRGSSLARDRARVGVRDGLESKTTFASSP